MRKNKYNRKKSVYDGIEFDSTLERDRYIFLKDQEKKGVIKDIKLQVNFMLQEGFVSNSIFTKKGNPSKISDITYTPDFVFLMVKTGDCWIEDAKGMKTEPYQLRKKLLLKQLQLEENVYFREVTRENLFVI